MGEYKLMLGKGLQFLVITFSVCLLLGLGAGAGITWYKNEQSESTAEVMNIDSEVSLEIATDTKEIKAEIHEEIENIDSIVDSAGYLDPEFLQLIQSARADAISRGDSTGFINAITHK